MKNFITIAVFNFPQEIVVLKSILENEGIVHYFENETIISVDPFASIAFGGIKLKIHPNDIEMVQMILDNLNSNLEIV
ncbi:MAG: DUF2007 domain-containing protein [Flavobacterium sp.]|jgi:hypothetical protein|uniref:DUF2007 domain-containing protein n=1 Tax=Flavobacterium macrobrachii TaxID=591204 RepID=A0ABS2D0X8_9FLAO|nr:MULTISPECIES: DUF2007 domain-containing protein [Flavobacterium]MBM6500816.1 DUF2007 domain-containing protein [Flavobacterium macrobrachii]MCZ8330029.1 DUF2007 domain-containing protein [Flavobacterium sp.]